MQVKNNETGEVEEIQDDSALPELVSAGKVSIPKKDYEFTDQAGDKYKVPAQGFLEAVKAGWKYKDQNIVKDEAMEAKYGDSTGKALLYGGARGLTFGLSDVLLEKTGAVSEEELSETKKRNPTASLTGEIGANIIPALLSGGSSLAAKAAAKTLPGMVGKFAARQGARAAANVTSTVAKAAIPLAVEGAIEGAAAGFGQTISEAELGDAEFNAETLLSNVGTGALAGGTIGAGFGIGGEYIKRGGKVVITEARKKAVKALGLSEKESAELLAREATDESLRKGLAEFSEGSEIASEAERLGLTLPKGVESNNYIVKQMQESLQESPSIAGSLVRQEVEPFEKGLRGHIDNLTEKASTIEPYEAGNEAKRLITQGINSTLRPAQEALGQIYSTFGNFDVRERMAKLLLTRMEKSDIYKISLDGGLVNELKDTVGKITTLNQANMFKKRLGQRLSAEFKKPDRNMAVIDMLEDAYQTLGRMERKSIEDASMLLGPKTGPKAAKTALKTYDEAMQSYRDLYKQYTPIADSLGKKLKSADVFLDTIDDIDSEVFTKKLLDINSYDTAKELFKTHPEIYAIARKQKLAEFAAKIKGPKGEPSFQKFLTATEKMSSKQKEILFGFGNKTTQKIDDMIKVIKKMPKDKGSRTSVNLSFLDMLNPVFQGKELLRYAVYKGGDKAMKDYLLKVTPVLSAIEHSSNKSKNKIAASIDGFYKASTLGIAAGTIKTMSEGDIDKAKKSYEMVQSSPGALVDKFVKNNQQLFNAAPETANALQQRLIAGVQFLQSKTPHRDQDYLGEDLKPSRSELLKFADYMEAVEKPQIVYEQLKQGYLNPNTLETLRVVYPKTYSNIQAELMAKLPKNLSRAQKIQLQPILGSKVTPAMDYQNLMRLQNKTQSSANAEVQAKAEMNRIPASAARNIKASERAQTGLDKALYRP